MKLYPVRTAIIKPNVFSDVTKNGSRVEGFMHFKVGL